jgi:hypothetical protein
MLVIMSVATDTRAVGALSYQFVRGEHPRNPLEHDYIETEKRHGDRPVRLPA